MPQEGIEDAASLFECTHTLSDGSWWHLTNNLWPNVIGSAVVVGQNVTMLHRIA